MSRSRITKLILIGDNELLSNSRRGYSYPSSVYILISKEQ